MKLAALVLLSAVAVFAEDKCIMLMGGFGAGSVPEYYHPDEGVVCDEPNMSNEALDKTTFTSGCFLPETNQIIVRESGFLFNRKDSVLYNLADGTSETIPNPLGSSRTFYSSSTLKGNTCISCGGFNGLSAVGDCFTFDATAKQWVAEKSLPIGRGGAATVVLGENVYVVGGSNFGQGPIFKDIYRLTPGGEYELVASMQKERESHNAVKLDENRLIACGGEALPQGRLATCEIFDQTTGQVTQAASLNKARSGFGFINFNGVLYAVGGNNLQNLDTVEVYDAENDTWTFAKSLNAARYSGVVVSI